MNEEYKPSEIIDKYDKFARYLYSILYVDIGKKEYHHSFQRKILLQDMRQAKKVLRIVNDFYNRSGKLLSYDIVLKLWETDFEPKTYYKEKYFDMYWEKMGNPMYMLDNTPIYYW